MDVDLISEETKDRLRQMYDWQRNFKVFGAQFANRPGGASLVITPQGGDAGQRPRTNVTVKVDSVMSGKGGKYNGTMYPAVDLVEPGTGDLELPQGTTGDGIDCLIENEDEDGNDGTHWLRIGGYADGWWVNMSTEAEPRPVVRIKRGQYRTESPDTLGSNAERLTADAATWARYEETDGTDYGGGPVRIWFGTGCYYDHTASPPVLKQHMRPVTFAADGRGFSIGPETDYTIDDPDLC